MQRGTFDEFVKERTAPNDGNAGEAPDWEKRREEWRSSLSQLYSDMERYLKSYIDSGAICVERTPVELTEDYLGTYEVEELTLAIGRDKVSRGRLAPC